MSTPTRRPRRFLTIVPLVAGCAALAAVPALAGATKTPVTDVAIAKSAAKGSYEPGETVTWTITVANTGQTTLPTADVVVSDPTLANLAPVDDGKAGEGLAPGETLAWTGARVVSAADCGVLSNTATVALRGRKTGQGDGSPANDSATASVVVSGGACVPVIALSSALQTTPAPSTAREALPSALPYVCPRPRLRARVTGPATVTAGQAARFRIAVHNAAGAPAARRARLTMRLPPGFALAAPGKISHGAMRMSLGTLAPRRGRSIAVTLRADRTTSGRQALRASVSARCGTARAKALVRVARAVENQVRPPVTG